MTRRKKILLWSAAGLVLVIGAINIFLFAGMTGLIKKYLPDISRTTGINIDLDKIWAVLPSGSVRISGLKMNNPKEFSANSGSFLSAGNIRANVSLLSLLRGKFNISSLDIKDGNLSIVRNQAGKLNTTAVSDSAKNASSPGGTGTPAGTGQQNPETKTPGLPGNNPAAGSQPGTAETAIGKVQIETILQYIDFKAIPADGGKLRLKIKIAAENISTYGDPDSETGDFSITGHLEDKPESFVINIRGKIAPMVNPKQPTFDINGTIANIRTEDFKELADSQGIEIGRADIDLNIKCRQGSYSRETSVVNAKISNLKASGKLVSLTKGASLSSANLSIPLKGTFEAPDFDPVGSIIDTLTGNIENITKALKSNKKVEKEINNFLDGILGGKKKK